MKIYYTVLASAFAGITLPRRSSAWVHTCKSNLIRHRQQPTSVSASVLLDGSRVTQQQCHSRNGCLHTASASCSTTALCATPSASVPKESTRVDKPGVIAEGKIVSVVSNGLVAVNVDVEQVGARSGSSDSDEKASTAGITPGSKSFMGGGATANSKENLGGDLTGRSVILPDQTKGVVVAHRPPIAFVYSGKQASDHSDGGIAQILEDLESVSMGTTARIMDCFGQSINGDDDDAAPSDTSDGSSDNSSNSRKIFAAIPQVKDIALINSPLVTGITMFDALAPIGNGQNMLMIGHDLQDMRAYVRDILASQKDSGLKCVYAITSDAEEVQKSLAEAGVLEDVTLVVPTENGKDASSMAAEAVTICATACAVGEIHALKSGEDALVIIDNIDQQKKLWDITTQVLVDVFGVDAVVQSDREGGASSEMRAFYSSLIQRSAQYNMKNGGGSVTLVMLTTIPQSVEANEDAVFDADDFSSMGDKIKERISLLVNRSIPLTSGNLKKVGIPIPSDAEGRRRLALQHVDDLISMSDGQIWFDESLSDNGQRPCMDPQRSITRVGIGADTESRADAPAIRRIVEGLRLDLAQAASMEGADVATKASIQQIRKAKALLLAMHQPSSMGGRSLSESCTVILAASRGYLDDAVDGGKMAGTAEGDALIKEMLQYVRKEAAGPLTTIDETLDMTDEVQSDIEGVLEAFFGKE